VQKLTLIWLQIIIIKISGSGSVAGSENAAANSRRGTGKKVTLWFGNSSDRGLIVETL
jgi:hypothetical protein